MKHQLILPSASSYYNKKTPPPPSQQRTFSSPLPFLISILMGTQIDNANILNYMF
jgi:hypothetical protein